MQKFTYAYHTRNMNISGHEVSAYTDRNIKFNLNVNGYARRSRWWEFRAWLFYKVRDDAMQTLTWFEWNIYYLWTTLELRMEDSMFHQWGMSLLTEKKLGRASPFISRYCSLKLTNYIFRIEYIFPIPSISPFLLDKRIYSNPGIDFSPDFEIWGRSN